MKVTTDACLFGAWTAAQLQNPSTILDIGAGTGLLSLMLAQSNTARIEAIEIESSCFRQLQENITNSPFHERVRACEGDVKEWKSSSKYDIIICNPPFHQDQLKSGQKNIDLARHDEGLTLPELFTVSSSLISETGELFVLLPYYRLHDCLTTAAAMGWKTARLAEVQHSVDHAPFRAMFRFSREAVDTVHETIMIHERDGSYTAAFTTLLQSYYLYL